jgi:hypothetical protein
MAPMTSARMKLGRAGHHIAELEQVCRTFIEDHPFEAIRAQNLAAGKWEVRVHVNHELPAPILGVIIGDIVHNLRTALDHLICLLVAANDPPVNTNTMFPFAPTEKDWKSARNSRAKGAHEDVLEVLDVLQPYAGGNDVLYRLHQLDIADKHKLLIASAAQNVRVGVPLASLFKQSQPTAGEGFEAIMREIEQAPQLKFAVAEPVPLAHGALLYSSPLAGPPPEVDFDWEIRLATPEVATEELAKTIMALKAAATAAVDALEPLLPS